jgi:hypothetical protein
MPDLVKRPRFKVGDKVRVNVGNGLVGTVTEARGTYHADGNVLYHVYVPMNPEPLQLLVREDAVEPAEEA